MQVINRCLPMILSHSYGISPQLNFLTFISMKQLADIKCKAKDQ